MPAEVKSTLAVIGATGNVGRNVVAFLVERGIVAPSQIELFASNHSAGKKLSIAGHDWIVQEAASKMFCRATLCLFATESDVSKKYITEAIESGSRVIDASSLYRLDPAVPLIVAPVNHQQIDINKTALYAMANCVASPISIVLSALQSLQKIKRVVIATYQSTSGAGKGPMDELFLETKSRIENTAYVRKHFSRQIAFNIIPQIDKFLEDGSTYEEFKIINEIKKILSAELPIAITSVRVPVMIGHSAALTIEFENEFSLADVSAVLAAAKSVKVSRDHYTTPVEVVGSDDVSVGRIRRDSSVPFGLQLWICSDNLRRGAATDMVEVADEILKQLQRGTSR